MLRALSEEMVCPAGCVGTDGEGVKFTWYHVQFMCGECELVGRRRRWVEAALEVKSRLDMEVKCPNQEWRSMCEQGAAGVPSIRGDRVALEKEVGSQGELAMRRCVGGLVNGTGLVKGAKQPDSVENHNSQLMVSFCMYLHVFYMYFACIYIVFTCMFMTVLLHIIPPPRLH